MVDARAINHIFYIFTALTCHYNFFYLIFIDPTCLLPSSSATRSPLIVALVVLMLLKSMTLILGMRMRARTSMATVLVSLVSVPCQVSGRFLGSSRISGSQLKRKLSLSSAFFVRKMFFILEPIAPECSRGTSRGNIRNFSKRH
jgi:hypothetical protein